MFKQNNLLSVIKLKLTSSGRSIHSDVFRRNKKSCRISKLENSFVSRPLASLVFFIVSSIQKKCRIQILSYRIIFIQ